MSAYKKTIRFRMKRTGEKYTQAKSVLDADRDLYLREKDAMRSESSR